MRSCIAILGIALAAWALGCSSDDASAAPDASVDATADTSSDASPSVDADATTPAPFTAILADARVYLGQEAALAVMVTPATPDNATYAWSLTPPTGSALTTASLAPTGPTLRFVPDVRGDFALAVTVTAGGASTTATDVVHVDAAPVFYTRATFDSNGGEVAVHVAGTDGSGEHAVACAITFNATESSQYRLRTLFAAATTTDAWEAPPGQASRFAFSGTKSLAQDDAGNLATFLIAGTTSNSCNSVPTTLRDLQAPNGALGQPRFSPDGSRIAFVDPVGASFGVSTIGFDATGYRAVAPIYAAPPSGTDESANIRPEWRDATHVAWPRPGANAWSLMSAPDAANAAPSVLMTCPSATTPHHVAFAGDSAVIASYAPASGAATDLFVLSPGANAACTVVRNLTKLTGAASRAHDFALSPDGKWIAYLHYDATKNDGGAANGNDGDLYVVPVDGSKPPAPLTTPALLGRIGPRWIAGGTALAFTRAAPGDVADGGDDRLADRVTVISFGASADGGAPHDLAAGNGVDVVTGAIGPGGSCAMARGTGSAWPLPFAGAIVGIGFSRRRRSRSAAS